MIWLDRFAVVLLAIPVLIFGAVQGHWTGPDIVQAFRGGFGNAR